MSAHSELGYQNHLLWGEDVGTWISVLLTPNSLVYNSRGPEHVVCGWWRDVHNSLWPESPDFSPSESSLPSFVRSWAADCFGFDLYFW